jgi:pantothenate kinase-related protein Tda10
MKTLFIGISGVAGSGKDLFFKLLKNELGKKNINTHRYSLADSLKQECNDYLKSHHQIDIFNCSREEKDSVRPFLVFHGTMKRNQSEGRHWIDVLDKKIKQEAHSGVICVTDIRYDKFDGDEVDWIKNELDGILIHVNQEGIGPANEEEASQDPRLLKKSNYRIEWKSEEGGQKDIESQLTEKHITKFIKWLTDDYGYLFS